MSYESVVSGLKALMRRDLLEMDPAEHKVRVQGESDRSSIIMQGAVLERFVTHELVALMPTINDDEKSAIFRFEGPCGSFSSKIKLAQALGIIDRKLRKQLDLVREMRNVAAHAHPDIGYDTAEIRNAVCALVEAKHRDLLAAMPATVLRRTFDLNLRPRTGCFNRPVNRRDENFRIVFRRVKEAGSLHPRRNHRTTDLYSFHFRLRLGLRKGTMPRRIDKLTS